MALPATQREERLSCCDSGEGGFEANKMTGFKQYPNFCHFIPISVKIIRFHVRSNINKNGAKAYVKNLRVFSQRKIRETWFYEIF
jgi:hypothetical protein